MTELKKVRLENGMVIYDCDVFQVPDSEPLEIDDSINITGNLYLVGINLLANIQTGDDTFLCGNTFCDTIYSLGEVILEGGASARNIIAIDKVSLKDHSIAYDVKSFSEISLSHSSIATNVCTDKIPY